MAGRANDVKAGREAPAKSATASAQLKAALDRAVNGAPTAPYGTAMSEKDNGQRST